MKQFQFKLERILELRKYHEHNSEVDLGRAIGVLVLLENKLKQNAAEYRRGMGERFNSGYMEDIMRCEHYLQRLEQEKERLLTEAAQASRVIEQKRLVFLEAKKEREILDKLKEKQSAVFRKSMLLEEIKMIDDIAGGAAARRKLEER